MHLALWATELSFNPTGFVVPGQWRKGRRQLHTRNFFQSLLLPLCGALTGSLRVEFLCDNESVVAVLKSGTSRDQGLMFLLRYLSMLAVRHSFSFTASSVRGKSNPIADALSRFQLQQFRRLAPYADLAPTEIPASLLASRQMS